ncbi:MAG: tetratricopeptide repeat protein [Rikenellaceae bacterium]|jgi:tetratricopeptide (TPR) repeat protein|nr:tetratricopeptide repeat protein [Rikenellaceae bacterium]
MATQTKKPAHVQKDPEVEIESALGKTELWFEKNWKLLTAVVVAILVVAGGVYSWYQFYQVPQGQKAGDAMFVAQQLFAEGDYTTALNGDGNNAGFAEVADAYKSTPQGRLAAHYAGICYIKLGDADAALDYLSRYKPTKGAPNGLINAQNEGLKGDICVDKDELSVAITHYRRAVEVSDNVMTAPTYLKKLGLALEATGNYAEAVKAYRRVADDYPTSLEARDIEKFASAAEQKL